MHIRWHIWLLCLSALMALPVGMWAGPNSKTGLYATKNKYVSQGLSVSVNALYYFGDVDNEGMAFAGGFNKNNMSYGGSMSICYNLPVGRYCNMKFGLMGGTLSGNNKAKFDKLNPPRDDYRKFNSVLIQPFAGVQYYPFSNAGLYLYGGVAFTASIITEFEFYYNSGGVRNKVDGSTYGILPMVQLGIGYSWNLTDSWSMSVEIMLQEGLADTHYMNLDAWPLAASQNSAGVELGKSSGTYTDRYGKEQFHWNDGWFQLGISVSYHLRECATCRVLKY